MIVEPPCSRLLKDVALKTDIGGDAGQHFAGVMHVDVGIDNHDALGLFKGASPHKAYAARLAWPAYVLRMASTANPAGPPTAGREQSTSSGIARAQDRLQEHAPHLMQNARFSLRTASASDRPIA